MNDIDTRIDRARTAHAAGLHGEGLRLVLDAFAVLDGPHVPEGARLFGTMFLWELLCAVYPPARAALVATRDVQLRRVLDGDDELETDALRSEGLFLRRARFSLLVQMNVILDDPASTHGAFVALRKARPTWAERQAWRALPAIVAVGDYQLADQCRGDPLAMLDAVNTDARALPLFPPAGAPRLAVELINLTRDVALGIVVLRGLGRDGDARALRKALLDGLESGALRELAERELDAPGTILHAIADHEMGRVQPPAA